MKENLDTEIDEFRATSWPEADIFMDDSLRMYEVAHGGQHKKITKGELCSFICNILCCNKARLADTKAAQADYGMNYKGEGKIYGSILVVDRSGRIVYSHAEQVIDDHPDVSDVVSAAVNHTGYLPAEKERLYIPQSTMPPVPLPAPQYAYYTPACSSLRPHAYVHVGSVQLQ